MKISQIVLGGGATFLTHTVYRNSVITSRRRDHISACCSSFSDDVTLLTVVYCSCTTVVALCRSDHLVHELSHRSLRRHHRLLRHSMH